jgi:hypothetical protein
MSELAQHRVRGPGGDEAGDLDGRLCLVLGELLRDLQQRQHVLADHGEGPDVLGRSRRDELGDAGQQVLPDLRIEPLGGFQALHAEDLQFERLHAGGVMGFDQQRPQEPVAFMRAGMTHGERDHLAVGVVQCVDQQGIERVAVDELLGRQILLERPVNEVDGVHVAFAEKPGAQEKRLVDQIRRDVEVKRADRPGELGEHP